VAAPRRRLDTELVRRGLAPTREQAQRSIAEANVTVNGSTATKASHMVLAGDALEVLGPPPRFVGRGGDKLEGALRSFGIDPTGLRCVDVGSSTGGFTDCLLQNGAASVVAIDVGRAQLHERLGRDPRVDVREQTDVRTVDPTGIGAPFDLVVIDVSFIGLDRILDVVAALGGDRGRIVALVKPQFEAGRVEADRGKGVIRDPDIWRRVLDDSVEAARRRGLCVQGIDVSPLKGGAGNVEFFLFAGGPRSGLADTVDSLALNATLDRAVALP
jgi:23S rRNA (cytidine1920-2'-O)/16S rRNA (cytidine1409-2'-O)-methyltransferase